ncbi:acyl-CoA N-acyltransferase [Polychytrium aggregatum]|uniref:acyl-CoA N-acyltransferase n=1 Tax=Polychytrium aggregatum TaxID=110093 RepID=UPI0022FEBE0E|nr:acyl-CoA N-acyltransferase [Polychytrium aggregatum]KAI9202553.1 acyl-CoA N-acyltransferase [Polychytrium aggregatum]
MASSSAYSFRKLESIEDFAALSNSAVLCYPGMKFTSFETRSKKASEWYQAIQVNPAKTMWGIFANNTEGIQTTASNPKSLSVVVSAPAVGSSSSELPEKDKPASTQITPTPGLLAYSGHTDFIVNLYGVPTDVLGLGFVGTDLLQKKKGLAKATVQFFLSEAQRKQHSLVALYAFRPEFYAKMGFSASTPWIEYTVTPAAFPRQLVPMPANSSLVPLGPADIEEAHEHYTRYAEKVHGMFQRTKAEIKALFDTNGDSQAVGWRDGDGKLRGYIIYTFKTTEAFLTNDIQVVELTHENKHALSGLLGFLHVQLDQIRHVKFPTQIPQLHRLLSDERDRNEFPTHLIRRLCQPAGQRAPGIMYRLVDLDGFFREGRLGANRNFNNQSIRVRFEVSDSFHESTNGWIGIEFVNGKSSVVESKWSPRQDGQAGHAYDAVVSTTIGHLTAVLVGSASVKELYDIGAVSIVPEDGAVVERVAGLLRSAELPREWTLF